MGKVLQMKRELCKSCKRIETYRKTNGMPKCIICEMPRRKEMEQFEKIEDSLQTLIQEVKQI